MREFKTTEIAQIKRTAQNVHPMIMRRNKISQDIENLQSEYQKLVEEIEAWETPIKKITNGFTTEQLIDRVVEDSGKVSKSGIPLKTTKYILKYPETIVPPIVDELESIEGIESC